MFVFSAVCNIILLVIVYHVNKKVKVKMEKRKKIALILRKMLEVQVEGMERDACFASGVEIEISRYVRDVGIWCLEEGGYDDVDIKRMHPLVIRRHPDLFEEVS